MYYLLWVRYYELHFMSSSEATEAQWSLLLGGRFDSWTPVWLILKHVRALSAMPPASSFTFNQCPNPRDSLFRIYIFFTFILPATTFEQVLIMIHADDFNLGFTPPLLLSLSFPCPLPSGSHYIPLLPRHLRSFLLRWSHVLQLAPKDLCAPFPLSSSATITFQILKWDNVRMCTKCDIHKRPSGGSWFNMLFSTHLRSC